MSDALPSPLAALLAAGTSSRMRGGDKLMEPVGGVPLLRLQSERLLTLGLPSVVTLTAAKPARAACLEGLAIRQLVVEDASEGMAASFRAVAEVAGSHDGLLCLLGDMPEIEAGDLARVLAAWRAVGGARVARGASAEGKPGQPVILPARLVPLLSALRGDDGARGTLAGEDVLLVPLPGNRAVTDLDTPEEWAAWRARTGIAG